MVNEVMNVRVYAAPPPIPGYEQMQYVAVDDNSEGTVRGFGPTVADALRDLADILEMME